jgi:hypothetical protein
MQGWTRRTRKEKALPRGTEGLGSALSPIAL